MTEGYYYVITLASAAVNVFVLLSCFELKKTMRYSIIWYAVQTFLTALLMGALRTAGIPAFHVFAERIPLQNLLYLIPMFLLTKGSTMGRLYVFFAKLNMVYLMIIFASFTARLFFMFESVGYLVVLTVLSLVLFASFCLFLGRHGKKLFGTLIGYIREPVWIFFVVSVTVSFFVLRGMYFTNLPIAPKEIPITMFSVFLPCFILSGLIGITVCIVIARNRLIAQSELNLARSVLTSGRDYYQKLNELTDRLRIQRHDSKYHISTIAKLAEKGDLDALREYLQTVDSYYTEPQLPMECGSTVINAFIDSFAGRCAAAPTQFSAKINLPKDIGIDDYELCIILGNLLENAIYATSKLAEPERYIDLIIKPNGIQLGLVVSNSFDGVVVQKDGELVSTKSDGGVGISSIKAVAHRHNGSYTPMIEGRKFAAYVVMEM